MKFYFDYFYYRIMKLFLRYPSDRGVRAITLISLMQSMLIISIIESSLPLFLRKDDIAMVLSQISWFILLVVLCLFFYNFQNYQGRYNEFDENWKSEANPKKAIKGLLIIISLLIPFVIYAYVTSRLYHITKLG